MNGNLEWDGEDGEATQGSATPTPTPTPEATHPTPPPAPTEDVELPKADAAPAKPSAFELPAELPGETESRVLLKKISATPANTRAELELKATAEAVLKQHIYEIQQGIPEVNITAADLGHAAKKHNASLKRERLDMLARENPEVAELLADYDALVKENAKLKKK